ncbi:bifunctional folylpolyglutamate synthase/dihydrofolate synthase [Urechidicola vernalis]|uniref:Dihydrofolate synthase/folylpolyglutamate synthase n=1 Tax=Urechidicola vernalis TaxID=3075600 RepID=A0ABU2Y352_9FLAO|nr:folylpolyglutamate synthase/dihydrofolate synthase family protein [Urechidicola sp. P050]MDT0552638.1 folylpolyglutamate synthase/dihydrofolate synthase family protein [Urechidicola sp. P050]
MTYQETLDWMFSQLPMYQNVGKTAFKKDLTNTILLSEQLNYPEKSFKSIHVAGTNGKGSTSHMLASVLQEAGYKVGLYTSPHLKDYIERIKVNGEAIAQDSVVQFIEQNNAFLKQHKLSFFEMTVGLAFDYFAKQKVDIAIIEVGLGGRLDSTNIISPLISVITNIGLDHTQMLGETLPEIAVEKAGIIKKNTPVVVGEYQKEVHHVFYEKAMSCNADLFLADKHIQKSYETDLLGSYQMKNLKTAALTLEVLRDSGFEISEDHLKLGFKRVVDNTSLLGRWQMLAKEPKTFCDTAHNREGLTLVLNQLKQETYENLHIVLGVVNDKDLESILPLFPKDAQYYFCKPNIPRGLDATQLKTKCDLFGLKGVVCNSVADAYKSARQNSSTKDFIYVGGSTFVVAEVV